MSSLRDYISNMEIFTANIEIEISYWTVMSCNEKDEFILHLYTKKL